MKTTSLFLLLTSLLLADTSTTLDILLAVANNQRRPDVTISTRARGGYGTSELQIETPKTDLYAGVFLQLDLISTADIRRQTEQNNIIRRKTLALLAEIKSNLELTWQLQRQRKTFQDRMDWHQRRIRDGIENYSAAIPVENKLIEINQRIYTAQANVQAAQLEIASYGGEKWQEVLALVRRWDRQL